jgi:hypothetical protein
MVLCREDNSRAGWGRNLPETDLRWTLRWHAQSVRSGDDEVLQTAAEVYVVAASVNARLVTLKSLIGVASATTNVYACRSCLEHSSRKPVNALG